MLTRCVYLGANMLSGRERQAMYAQAIEQWKLAFAKPVLSQDELAEALTNLGVLVLPTVDPMFTPADVALLEQYKISPL